MEDPRNLPAPDDPIERIHAFALDLVYGSVIAEEWKTSFTTNSISERLDRFENASDELSFYLATKWIDRNRTNVIGYPQASTLHSFGYFERRETGKTGITDYSLTPKAMQLLETPLTPPSVFISYARKHSSAFGLLIVSRLQQVGVEHPYIDMNIDPGDKWREDIEEAINACHYFVVLISPASYNENGELVERASLTRDNVQHEIRLVRETDATIVPIWHNGFNSANDYPDELEWLSEYNAIIVERENPDQYQSAVEKLRNRMGYAPR